MELWEKFEQSGKIADYLQYTAQKGTYDSERHCPDTKATA